MMTRRRESPACHATCRRPRRADRCPGSSVSANRAESSVADAMRVPDRHADKPRGLGEIVSGRREKLRSTEIWEGSVRRLAWARRGAASEVCVEISHLRPSCSASVRVTRRRAVSARLGILRTSFSIRTRSFAGRQQGAAGFSSQQLVLLMPVLDDPLLAVRVEAAHAAADAGHCCGEGKGASAREIATTAPAATDRPPPRR